MRNMKRGFIIQISRQDNIGIIRENGTMTEYIFFLDEIPMNSKKEVKAHSEVTFFRDPDYEQFVAIELSVVNNSYRMVV